ncbi:hypothetical protein H0H92_014821 [Tricholoma furcatifolium]|nr:hypothetical protein H0H92_014821 [Tricholoma furcatifolium]
MSFATSYDPNAPSEQPVALPSAPLQVLSETDVIQPPLTRRGTGPGIVLVLPPAQDLDIRKDGVKPLDPEPVQKWAEEGFSIAAITQDSNLSSDSSWSFEVSLKRCITALLELPELDVRDKFSVIVYDSKFADTVVPISMTDSRIVALVVYGSSLRGLTPTIPTLVHLHGGQKPTALPPNVISHGYGTRSPHFVLPQVCGYDPGSAAIAHSRTLTFLRKWLGGPIFDLETIWEEHTYFEFGDRSVAKTMGTMVMTGGVGRAELTAFYRDHFIFANPPDASMQTISRTVGTDRVVDEFIYSFTHDRMADWLLPGVPPSGKKLIIPMIAVVNIRGDRLYNEHIWWDQATVLKQAGILPEYLPYPTLEGIKKLRLPVAGTETAGMLAYEVSGRSNAMFGDDWGLQD